MRGRSAVSVRGFNGPTSNKLLVLVDGREVYVPGLPGVPWDQQLVPVEDIERIEVVRGPGAALWGANAVNGVINVVTKHAADSLGGAAALLDMTVEYLQTRRQFARPLAMFQALKHRCADLKALIAGTDALFWRLADEAERTSFDPLTEAGALKSQAAGVYYAVAEEAIQLHGGIGLTSEHPCHLFMKRALLNTALGGEADAWEAAAGQEAIRRLARA